MQKKKMLNIYSKEFNILNDRKIFGQYKYNVIIYLLKVIGNHSSQCK